MAKHRTLRVRCPTWDQVETFYAQKLHRGKRLVVRVPFLPEVNSAITVLLELPTGLVVAIDGSVILIEAGEAGAASTIELSLHGVTDEIIERLRRLVAEGRGQDGETRAAGAGETLRELAVPGDDAGPLDAPIDDCLEPPPRLEAGAVPPEDRPRFDALAVVRGQLLQSAAHEVLGVARDASIDTVQDAYLELSKRYHPDALTSARSPLVRLLAQEVFILINKAYDRLRQAAVSDGTAIICGPALLPHAGWMTGVDDFLDPRGAAVPPQPRPSTDPLAAARDGVSRLRRRDLSEGGLFGDVELPDDEGAASLDDALVRSTRSRKVEAIAREHLERADFEGAKEALAEGLHAEPRDRQLRALYHVVSGLAAAEAGQMVMATSQFEAALAHDRECGEAVAALDALRTASGTRGGLFRRILK